MERKQLKEVKKNEFFRLAESETAPVWVKTGGFSRKGGKTKYECRKHEDYNHTNFYGFDKVVFVGFTY